MGCLLGGVAALLGLAVPASIARSSLVGAYVTLTLLAGLAVAAVLGAERRRRTTAPQGGSRPSRALSAVAIATVLYAAAVTVINATG